MKHPFLSSQGWAVTRETIHRMFLVSASVTYPLNIQDQSNSVELFFSNFEGLDDSVGETDEKSVTKGVPGDWGNLVEFVKSDLLALFFFKVLLSFKFVLSFSNDGVVLGFEVPNLPSVFSTNGDPWGSWVEGEAVNWGSSIVRWGWLFNIGEVENSDFLVFSTGDDEVTSWWNGNGVDVRVVSSEWVLNVEGLVVPDFKISVPSDWGEELSSDGALWGWDESDLWDPIVVVVVFDGVFTITLDVPELDLFISTWWKNVSSVRWDSTWQNFFGVSVFSESLGGLSGSQIPESHGLVPWWGKEIVVVVGQGQVADEVGVSGEALDWFSEIWWDFWVSVEFPDQDGSVSWSWDQNLSIFVFLLWVTSFDGGNPIAVTLKVSDFFGCDLAFNFSHC